MPEQITMSYDVPATRWVVQTRPGCAELDTLLWLVITASPYDREYMMAMLDAHFEVCGCGVMACS